MSCPPPIGAVPREDCAEIADDFGAFSVAGAIPLAGAGREAGLRVEAIKAAGALGTAIKEQRVKLCESYVACKVPAADHDAQDQRLAGAMRSLIDTWNKRRLSRPDEILRFRDAIRAIEQKVTVGSGEPGALPARPPRTFKAEDVLARVEDPGVAFRQDSGSVIVSASADGKREALRSKPDALPLPGGHRYRIKVSGRYTPSSPPLVMPGDELVARLKYRAVEAADLQIALRSLEDPEASESADAFRAAAGEKGAREAKLTADPQQTGFYLGVSVRGAPVDLDDIELLRGGRVIAAARAEGPVAAGSPAGGPVAAGSPVGGPDEPGVKTDCALLTQKPIAGKASLRCPAGEGDRVTLGKPAGFLMIAVRDPGGERGAVRALSLEGGRSVDAILKDDGELVVTLIGPGSATLERVEVTDLGGA
jgi:hypothetical protein